MARKDLLKSLMGDGLADAPAPALPPRSAKGAIGAVSQSIAELRGRALVEVPADLIDGAGIRDRLDHDEDGIAALAESLRLHGQQVPVLLRHSPNVEGRYDIVYGRRRVAALRQLGRPVKAMVRDLNDRDLIVAQGQENSARKDLSFIEKANFARAMAAQGFDRKVICEALHIDKTVISRMLTVAEAVPEPVIRAIGAAPSAGRDRWLVLAARLGSATPARAIALAVGETSDIRFEAVLKGLTPQREAANAAQLKAADGAVLGEGRAGPRGASLKLTDAAFGQWLITHIDEIHCRFLKDGGE
ncbi:MAG: plasmid partitioning protein RepB [Proteobacteria bacterium]|nr:plasmid partitioning protein RepB [Pseudomonadota bacterium]